MRTECNVCGAVGFSPFRLQEFGSAGRGACKCSVLLLSAEKYAGDKGTASVLDFVCSAKNAPMGQSVGQKKLHHLSPFTAILHKLQLPGERINEVSDCGTKHKQSGGKVPLFTPNFMRGHTPIHGKYYSLSLIVNAQSSNKQAQVPNNALQRS